MDQNFDRVVDLGDPDPGHHDDDRAPREDDPARDRALADENVDDRQATDGTERTDHGSFYPTATLVPLTQYS